VASVSVATGISPKDLLEVDPAIYAAIKAILQERFYKNKNTTRRRK
jgi:hypothetical protein